MTSLDSIRAANGPATGPEVVRRFDVYGLTIEVGGDWAEVLDSLALDFAWFAARTGPEAGPPDVEVMIERGRPRFERFEGALAQFVTPRNVVYQVPGRTVVDYFGRALSVLDRAASRLLVQGEEPHLVHEAAYLYLISRIGEHVESRGLPRLHAVGLSGPTGAVAVLMPSGGGKSTLALKALRTDGVKLLSDDSPLLDRHGRLHPFPLRIGVNPEDAETLPVGSVRRIERMEFHPKLLVDVGAFPDRIETEPRPLRHLVLGRRSLSALPTLERVSRRSAVMPLVAEAVIGVGLYQGMEFVLQRGARDVLRKLRPAATRAACCTAALRSADVWLLTLGRDRDRNWEQVRRLLEL